MLEIEIPTISDLFDDERNEFIEIKGCKLLLEHSLISLRKWESKWHIPFLSDKDPKTNEMMSDYIRCMTISPTNVDPNLYHYIPSDKLETITKYIQDPMTATWFSTPPNGNGRKPFRKEIVTAEIIYYWMITLNIPAEYEKWHLNQLMTLIRVINAKNAKPSKMKKSDQLRNYAKLNEERLAKSGTRG